MVLSVPTAGLLKVNHVIALTITPTWGVPEQFTSSFSFSDLAEYSESRVNHVKLPSPRAPVTDDLPFLQSWRTQNALRESPRLRTSPRR